MFYAVPEKKLTSRSLPHLFDAGHHAVLSLSVPKDGHDHRRPHHAHIHHHPECVPYL